MGEELNIDKLDLKIIQQLMHDANVSYAEMGKKLFVSAGTIHVRIKKIAGRWRNKWNEIPGRFKKAGI